MAGVFGAALALTVPEIAEKLDGQVVFFATPAEEYGEIETLETTWKTIVNGIDETRQIQENARKQRHEDQARLENIKQEFNQMYHMPTKRY